MGYDECCEMRFPTWDWREGQEVCSNDPIYGAPDSITYDSRVDCCKGRFGSSRPSECASINKCNPKPETPEPTPKPTPSPVAQTTTPGPTPEPTACEARTWYFNSDTEICDNKDRDDSDDDKEYDSLKKCCKENFGTPSSNDEYRPEPRCPFDQVYDKCCEMKYPTWYWIPNQEVCTNEPMVGAPGSRTYDSRVECCKEKFGSSRPSMCVSSNYCYPEPETPEPTPKPTPNPVADASPPAPTTCLQRKWRPRNGNICTNADVSDGNIPVFDTLINCCEETFGFGVQCKYEDICFDTDTYDPTPAPTMSSTGGSTPTVSKDTTGPPTKMAVRGGH